ncbi:SLBB domain-containing protein [Xylanibacter muris]|uniref:Capsule biosynthesis protein n=1 Tax=Xylanibacter muris TaxID=2736290 RepID=A0ABX2AQT5_9BACT|nr:SLBB domain-containing protein [Xylanibacter muris]NPD92407.1 capsule biosynthesis protein [Xylanibacter muris]
MKRYIFPMLLLLACATVSFAQSSMSDQDIVEFVMKEQAKGTDQAQIVTRLMQRGVTIEQIRRVRNKYERQIQKQGLGTKDITNGAVKTDDRSRKDNGKKKRAAESTKSGFIIKDERTDMKNTYNEEDDEFMEMKDELSEFMPDSLDMIMDNVKKKEPRRKVFGRDIFNNKNLTFEPNMNIATPKNYRLGPGDAVYIDIYGASQKTIESTVTPDGTVIIDGYGPITVSGLTVEQANAHLRSTLGARYSSSRIQLTVGQTRTIMVNVMGEVKNPGTYTLSAFASVFHALYMAGGTNDIGTLRNIKVFRNNRLVTVVDIYDYILNGKLTGNIRLADNDVVVVGPYDCLVNITGKVKRPMFYEMKKNESVETLLKYSGGFTGDAYKKSVRLVRKAGTQYSVFNIGEFDMSSFQLYDEDSLSVDSILPRYSNMAEIKGAVFRPGMYQVGNGIATVKSLIENADGVTEDAFTAHAVMHRMKPDRTLEVLSVDVDGIMSGKVADIPLKNEDVLYIPSKKDLLEQQTLTIHGEVIYPGVYMYADNETLEDFILQAGGLTDAASIMKVDIARRIINPNALTSSDTIAHTYSFALKDGFVIDGEQGFKLMPYDEVYVRTSPGFSKQQNVKIEGEIMFPGTYTLSKKSQRISEIIKQSGGFTNTAFPQGARLERKITPDERLRMESVIKMANAQSGSKDSVDIKKLDLGETYFVGINLDKAIENPGSNYDVVLREGDRIIIPEYSGTVKISGDVMYPTTVAYREGKSISYYIDQAGGWGNRAKKNKTFIIYMNGTVAKASYSNKPLPGCEIVVSSRPINKKMSTAEIVAIGSGTASIATMIATIANLMK